MMARNLGLSVPEKRMDWIHRDNPDGSGCSWLLFEGDNPMPIASCNGIRRCYRNGEQTRTAIVLADVNSDPEYRYALPALVL
jgi:hypothetical protein